MRLDEKPYPGGPVTLRQIASVAMLETKSGEDTGNTLVRITQPTRNGPSGLTLPNETAIGYDALCPDWRERLGKVLDRLDREYRFGPGPPVDKRTFKDGADFAHKLLREEFGLDADA